MLEKKPVASNLFSNCPFYMVQEHELGRATYTFVKDQFDRFYRGELSRKQVADTLEGAFLFGLRAE